MAVFQFLLLFPLFSHYNLYPFSPSKSEFRPLFSTLKSFPFLNYPHRKFGPFPLNSFQIKEGPCLNNGRCSHGCAKMTFNGITILVVAGGYNGGHLDSVEILDPFFETLIKNNP